MIPLIEALCFSRFAVLPFISVVAYAARPFFMFADCCRLDLSMLATKPGYARLGLGSALVRWGVQQAEAQVKESPEGPVEGLYLESTPTGLPVYLRNGFREVASLTHDMGGEEGYKHVCVLQLLK